ncbi:Sucrose transport protein SUC7 [Abeliophyllum distichum]|uniref:Sucrose transport protein SUC7 n=1 Tax=Abeliophyllum distichum TaxID=126358 RepID=A0ABD1PA88_9LAMI
MTFFIHEDASHFSSDFTAIKGIAKCSMGTRACDVYCANLKSCFFLSIFLLLTLTILAFIIVPEKATAPSQTEPPENSGHVVAKKEKIPVFGDLFGALKDLPRPMRILLLVTCLNWVAWFPFLLFSIDWMGKEVYRGKVGEGKLYNHGVRAGALELMLSGVLGAGVVAGAVGGEREMRGCGEREMRGCLEKKE